MRSLPLPLTPRFITWTLATAFAVLLGVVAVGNQQHLRERRDACPHRLENAVLQ